MSQPLLLKHKCDDAKLFSKGSLNVFSLLSVCDVGDLQSVELLSDGSGVTLRAVSCTMRMFDSERLFLLVVEFNV